eukprot:138080-Chlamydomonas_euryale.AAC.2
MDIWDVGRSSGVTGVVCVCVCMSAVCTPISRRGTCSSCEQRVCAQTGRLDWLRGGCKAGGVSLPLQGRECLPFPFRSRGG